MCAGGSSYCLKAALACHDAREVVQILKRPSENSETCCPVVRLRDASEVDAIRKRGFECEALTAGVAAIDLFEHQACGTQSRSLRFEWRGAGRDQSALMKRDRLRLLRRGCAREGRLPHRSDRR